MSSCLTYWNTLMSLLRTLKVLLLCLCTSTAFATDIRAKITWDPNPASENIGWYIIEWFDGNAGNWIVFEQTSGTPRSDGRLTYESTLRTPFDAPVGTEICIQITAAKSNERSEPSEQACANVTSRTPVTPPAEVFLLTPPTGVTVELELL